MSADLSPLVDSVLGHFTSTTAIVAYSLIAAPGILIGFYRLIGVRLWNYFWAFVPDGGGGAYADYDAFASEYDGVPIGEAPDETSY